MIDYVLMLSINQYLSMKIIKNENSESYSHVASSCRRIIKDVADGIFPAKKEPIIVDGKKL